MSVLGVNTHPWPCPKILERTCDSRHCDDPCTRFMLKNVRGSCHRNQRLFRPATGRQPIRGSRGIPSSLPPPGPFPPSLLRRLAARIRDLPEPTVLRLDPPLADHGLARLLDHVGWGSAGFPDPTGFGSSIMLMVLDSPALGRSTFAEEPPLFPGLRKPGIAPCRLDRG